MIRTLTRADGLALRLLLGQKLYGPKIDVCSLKLGYSVIFDSIQNFCENSRATLEDIAIGGCVPDGYTIRHMRGGCVSYIVLYNSEVRSHGRRRFTLAHEIGHILLEHATGGTLQENEADTFAAQLLLPRVFAWELFERSGFSVTPRELAKIFGVSVTVAERRLGTLRKERPPLFSADEIMLRDKFSGLLPQLDGPLVDC